MPGRIAWISVAPVKGMALEQRDEVELEPFGVIENRRFHVIGDGRPAAERQAARRRSSADRPGVGRGLRASCRSASPTARSSRGHGRARRDRDDELLRARRRGTPGRRPLVRGDDSSFVGRELRLVQPVEPGAGRRPRPAARVAPLDRLARGDARGGRASTSRSTPGASGCCSASTGSARTRRTPGSAGRVRVGEAEVAAVCGNVGRCIVTSRHPETGARTLPTLDVLAEYRHGVETTEPLPFGVWGRGDGAGPGARSATRSTPAEAAVHPELESEQAYVDHAYACLEEMRRQIERAGEAGIGEVEALVLEAWAAKRLVTFEDAERGLCFGRLDLDGVRPAALRRPPLGARGADADRRQLAGAGCPRLLHRDRRRAAGRRAPPPVPHRGPRGCSTSTTSRSTARPATSSTASPTSCSRSSSAAATSTCATSSRRSRPTSTA